jgi:hypothetical protein
MNLALLLEMMDRRIRSARDAIDTIEGPVLAVLNRTSKRLKLKRGIPFVRRKALSRPQTA